ncbi:hypothetical protein ABZU32_05590 [Sphaerisporangium sp. NPDC005288]|uniref:hypothetical protein n=1 Tax=Sphaerisporangium sp. NPDC005288 TaxID=3155114 RepID=UPI0033BBA7CB
MIENDESPPAASAANARRELPFTEGSVWSIQFAQTKPGMTAEYLRNLGAGWTPLMDEAKREGLILDYRVLVAPHVNRDDWDVMLMVEVRNMAALDGYQEKMNDLAGRVSAGNAKQDCAQFRDLLGMKLVREITLRK